MQVILTRTGQVIPADGSQDFRYIIFTQKIFRKQDVDITQMQQALCSHRVRAQRTSLNSLLYVQVITLLRKVQKVKIMHLIL